MRLVAVTGFALAGWLALTALTESASAAAAPAHPDDTVRNAAPAFHGTAGHDIAPGKAADRPALGAGTWRREVSEVPERIREIGDDPVRYLQTRRHEVLDRKERALQQVGHSAVEKVEHLADTAGVPRVRIGDVPQETPIVGKIVHGIADVPPVLQDEERPAEAHDRPAEDSGTQLSEDERRDAAASHGARQSHAAGVPAGDAAQDDCAECRGDRHQPGPALPSAQDNPRGAGSGGPTFAPVADLVSGRYPAAPPAAGLGTFRRTALTDVAAPGGPAVVPD
ncbi:hypothetical protein ACN3XK_04715 [Actinomadura welshii]